MTIETNLKVTAEHRQIRQRMRGGALSKAARGELRVRLPVGLVYDEQNRVVLDPDQQVREALHRELPIGQWHTFIPAAHPGYISWDDYQRNRKRLEGNTQGRRAERTCPPREGSALLQGLVVCGRCGRRLSVRYYARRGSVSPNYLGVGVGRETAEPKCQSLPGEKIDEAIGQLLLQTLTPVALEVSLAVQEEVRKRFDETDRLRWRQVERTRYEADLAKRRYMKVDPANRLVAEELEAEWNRQLRALREAEEEYQRQREQDRQVVSPEQRENILALAQDFPALWRNPKTPPRERKRMVQLLLEDVTPVKGDPVSVKVRFKGGATRSLNVARNLASYETWTTNQKVVAEIDRMLDHHTYSEIAATLNQRQLVSGQGRSFDGRRINVIRRAYGLKDRRTRLREQGLLTAAELAVRVGTTARMVKVRRLKGTLPVDGQKLNDIGSYM